jgi:uncharacterized membrane protein YoaT (DUF817 family)
MVQFLEEFWIFSWRNALSCIFPAFIFLCLGLSHLIPAVIPRYDFMLLMCLVMQIVMVLTRLESKDEVLVICVFHVLGLMMELYKVSMGSWSYPEFAYTKISGVPLYSGFMYASVASFMCQAWRRFDLKMERWPRHGVGWVLGAAIYINFFTLHLLYDLRWVLSLMILIAFLPSKVYFTTTRSRYFPVVLSFLLIGLFIWFAENAATFLGAWKYTYQHKSWQMVKLHKISSWTLMAIVSYIIVAQLKLAKYGRGVQAASGKSDQRTRKIPVIK